MADHMLTTTDNPFNPFTQFDAWFQFDTLAGYDTLGYLSRILRTSDALSQPDQDVQVEAAMDEIVKFNPFGIYRKVEEPEKVEGGGVY